MHISDPLFYVSVLAGLAILGDAATVPHAAKALKPALRDARNVIEISGGDLHRAAKSRRDTDDWDYRRSIDPLSKKDVDTRPLSPRDTVHKSLVDTVHRSLMDTSTKPLSPRDAVHRSLMDTSKKPTVHKSLVDTVHRSLMDTSTKPLSPRDTTHRSLMDSVHRSLVDTSTKPLSLKGPVTKSKRDIPSPKLAAPNSMYSHDGFQVTSDHVLRYLQDRGLVAWAPSGTGKYTHITDDLWQRGLGGAVRRKRSFAPIDLNKGPSKVFNNIWIKGQSASITCYTQGLRTSALEFEKAVMDACHAFGASPLPSQSIRMWEMATVNAKIPRLRFSIRVLEGTETLDETLCQVAFDQIRQRCATNGDTAGGEATMGRQFILTLDSMDPEI
ncbi:hypothetical protein H112_06801 [Trichophyton rubrum D6]|uniref:Uncharacterized protein n=3 Tax=Trichophyton rubrum TaxID=5551 RepID=A0A178F0Q1_TRIRU|nr:uncharacterized protein TERG_02149 [Trichophyton rubrum CBS 118892]EZF12178.1 hypothetical protein H100_06823 [Trichophyton rubrum MR850]EZF39035.1 hypothetical protein H102_06784 [Trichophyton rubrum CBS 100081]EZF49675.1 hypothetical protein H103_06809 [Trichophyton rubrum CBS 288.86]EZF60313.1 hypothetical protein H104_06763 [Trichophyton rubrum CBS 289.86]EZF81588.1 hypothetical protein H110_06805 [Trichophyton rubrum MR1448]EZF92251.1 hypothetical protein H113_06856 [Trichophyton rubr